MMTYLKSNESNKEIDKQVNKQTDEEIKFL